jgi:RNA polymerase sigma factor (sigma-70 family)
MLNMLFRDSFDRDAALTELLRLHRDKVYRFALRLTGNTDKAMDLTQDAFVRAFKNIDRYDSDRPFESWIFTILNRLFLNAATCYESRKVSSLDAGAEDFTREGEPYIVTTLPAAFHAVQDALKARGFAPESAELAMVPKNTVKVEGADAERILRLVEVLEELDDVSKVFSNFDIYAAQLAEAET